MLIRPFHFESEDVALWTDCLTRKMMAPGGARASIMELVVWPQSVGLGQYEAVFRENDLDETVLPSLTSEDLEELGIGALGHRRKLFDAIAALRTDGSGD